jgi:hypothetical protein
MPKIAYAVRKSHASLFHSTYYYYSRAYNWSQTPSHIILRSSLWTFLCLHIFTDAEVGVEKMASKLGNMANLSEAKGRALEELVRLCTRVWEEC